MPNGEILEPLMERSVGTTESICARRKLRLSGMHRSMTAARMHTSL